MTEKLNVERLGEIAESDYLQLEELYAGLRALKGDVDRMHDDYVASGTPPVFDRVEAVYLRVNELFEGLERYLLPACDPDSAVTPVHGEDTLCRPQAEKDLA